jgi:hypothetical protein
MINFTCYLPLNYKPALKQSKPNVVGLKMIKMRLPVITKVLVMCMFAFSGFAQSQVYQISKKKLYGNWTSDRPLYGNVMKISFKKNGKYAELIKDVKTNVIKSSFEGSFKLVNDSTIRIKSQIATSFHLLHFMNKDLIRFYSPKDVVKNVAVPPLYMYNFVRDKR